MEERINGEKEEENWSEEADEARRVFFSLPSERCLKSNGQWDVNV